MRLITKLTMICILISALEKLVTYVSMRMFPYQTGEYNLLVIQIWNVLGLEFGILFAFVLSAMCFVGIKKVADIWSKSQKVTTVLLIILIIVYGCVLIFNLCMFMSML